MIACVDESMRQTEDGLYVLAAVMVLVEDADAVRRELRSLLLPRQQRLHWRDESDERRLTILKRIADIEVMACVVSRSMPGPSHQERCRAKCLRALLWELKTAGIVDLVIESRQRRNDQQDRRIIVATQQAGEASKLLNYTFEKPKQEPLLWLPDAVAGAWSSGEETYVELLGGIVETERKVP